MAVMGGCLSTSIFNAIVLTIQAGDPSHDSGHGFVQIGNVVRLKWKIRIPVGYGYDYTDDLLLV